MTRRIATLISVGVTMLILGAITAAAAPQPNGPGRPPGAPGPWNPGCNDFPPSEIAGCVDDLGCPGTWGPGRPGIGNDPADENNDGYVCSKVVYFPDGTRKDFTR